MKKDVKTKKESASSKKTKKEMISSMSQKQRKMYYLKKTCIIILIAFAVLAAILLAIKFLFEKETEEKSIISQIQEQYPTYTPFEAEWDVDLSQDTEYLSRYPYVMYGIDESGSLYALEDENASNLHEGQKFFLDYFKMLKEGNYEKYPCLFTETYKNTDPSKRFEKNVERVFPPQRVYDIEVRELGRFKDTDKNVLNGVYKVTYKINKNSNLFRSDIGWDPVNETDIMRPLIFELITENPGGKNEKTYISNVYTETTAEAYARGNVPSEE